MTEKFTTGETHGCVVCGKLYQMYVVRDALGKFVDAKVMSVGARLVSHPQRPLAACESHAEEQVEAAVLRIYGKPPKEDDED
ncbi:MAG: hypothetical protein KA473_17095 [Anaerolineales bacterium]|nr:hypothetical protein [Anaerolineales bacterium]MBP6211150.1 hypothetical protein [Anaerolineales bacterium]